MWKVRIGRRGKGDQDDLHPEVFNETTFSSPDHREHRPARIAGDRHGRCEYGAAVLSARTTDELRSILQQRQAELRGRMARITTDLGRATDPLSVDAADRAVQMENDDVLNEIGLSAESELSRIEKAITRMADGRYGICEKCGASIEAARLQVVPFAAVCAECARVTP